VGYAQIGQVVLVSHTGTPAEFLVEHTPHFHLVSCFEGNLALKTAGGSIQLSRNGAALLPCGLRHSNGSHSLAGLTLLPAAVAAAAAAIAGPSRHTSPTASTTEGIYQPVTLSSGPRLEMIHGLLNTIDTCVAAGPWAATHLGLDDVVVRIAATLLQPDLLDEDPPDLLRYRGREGKSSFDDLIDYIRNNLDQPLRLSDLESRSHYSRRALQYAFQQRLQTTPKQWIREQRLSLALKHLQSKEKRPTVHEVALLCGYVRVRHFSKDFKARFGLSPSQARRL
jgi:AraC-like DNA-binding protein